MDYSGYPEYAQIHPPFEHEVTILDLLFHVGADGAALHEELRRRRREPLRRAARRRRALLHRQGARARRDRTRRRLERRGVAAAALSRAAARPAGDGPFSIIDYGCGYGALVDVLASEGTTSRTAASTSPSAMLDARARALRERPRRPLRRRRGGARAARLHGRERHLQRPAGDRRRGHGRLRDRDDRRSGELSDASASRSTC